MMKDSYVPSFGLIREVKDPSFHEDWDNVSLKRDADDRKLREFSRHVKWRRTVAYGAGSLLLLWFSMMFVALFSFLI